MYQLVTMYIGQLLVVDHSGGLVPPEPPDLVIVGIRQIKTALYPGGHDQEYLPFNPTSLDNLALIIEQIFGYIL